MNNLLTEFFRALQLAGVAPASPSALVADGLLHRHRVEDDKLGTLNGWHILHLDSPVSGAGGSWKTGTRHTWCNKRQSALTSAERETLRLRIESDKRRAQEATEARHRDAAAKAARIWKRSAPASLTHPYLLKKQVAPGIARQSRGALVLPVAGFDGGALHGLQFIAEDGGKLFLQGMAKAGHFIPTGGTPDGTRPLWICEGWATASTLAALKPGVCVVAALDCGNLASVATESRKRWPALDIVVCPDFDAVGRQKGKETAIAVRARILPPPATIPPGATDWNDLSQWRQGVPHVG